MLRALLFLLFLRASKGVKPEKICVKSGEIVALECPGQKSPMNWTIPHTKGPHTQNQTGLLIFNESLVLLSASESQQGNYTCKEGDSKKTFELKVYTTLSDDCWSRILFSQSCIIGHSCPLFCPEANIPKFSTSIISKGVTWKKDDRLMNEAYFKNVKESDQGVYSCVRSFVFDSHIYNRTFKVKLNLKQNKPIRNEVITSPEPPEIFVDVGSPLKINCTAVLFSEYSDLYWIFNNSVVNTDSSSRIYSSTTEEKMSEGSKWTVSLVFKEVSEADLSTPLRCKLESTSPGTSEQVNVTLVQKVRRSYAAVTITAVVVPVVVVFSVLISIKYKIHITLFLRDTLGCHHRASDGKSFDACIMYYSGERGAGLGEEDRKTLQDILENHFGYSLCLFDRDVLPGQVVSDAVLECVEQSRAVLLVPASQDLSSESALLSAVHEALVERQTRLIFIQTKSTEETGTHPVSSEPLQQLMDLGHCVTWRGTPDQTSFFWKQLRYYLPPSQQQHRMSLLPQTV